MSYYNCIDVSEHNKEIDWKQARADDSEFAIIRAGFGRDYEYQDDKYFHINMREALANGVKVGVYFYSYAKDEISAISEAKHCLRLVEPYRNQLSLPVFYDVEEESIEPYVDVTIPAFTKELNNAGYNVGVYATGYWFTHCLQYVPIDYLWVAYTGSPDDGTPHEKPEWCDIWQYTHKGSCIGVGYDCVDCDIVYNKDMKALIEDQPPEPEPSKPMVFNADLTINYKDNKISSIEIKPT